MRKLVLKMLIILMLLSVTVSCTAEETISSPASETEADIQSEAVLNTEGNTDLEGEETILEEPAKIESTGEFQNNEAANVLSSDSRPQIVEVKNDTPFESDRTDTAEREAPKKEEPVESNAVKTDEHSESEPSQTVKADTSELNVPETPEKAEAQDKVGNREEEHAEEKKDAVSNETNQVNGAPESKAETAAPALPGDAEVQDGNSNIEEENANEEIAAASEETDQANAATEPELEVDIQLTENEAQEVDNHLITESEQIAETASSEADTTISAEETLALNEMNNAEEELLETEDAEKAATVDAQGTAPSESEEQNGQIETDNELEKENQPETEIVAFIAKVEVEIFPNGDIIDGMAFSLKARVIDANEAYALRWEQHDPATDKMEEAPLWEKIGEGETLNLTASLDLNQIDYRLVVTGEDETELNVAVQHMNIISKSENEDIPTEEPDEEIVEETEPEENELPVEELPAKTDETQPHKEEADMHAGEANEASEEKTRRVIIHSSAGTCIINGAPIVLTVELEGFEDNAERTVIWEINKGDGWEEAGIGETFEYLASLESLSWDFRVKVQYTL